MIPADLNIILPEIVVSVFAMLALVGAVYTGKDKLASVLTWATAAVFVIVALWIAGLSGDHQSKSLRSRRWSCASDPQAR